MRLARCQLLNLCLNFNYRNCSFPSIRKYSNAAAELNAEFWNTLASTKPEDAESWKGTVNHFLFKSSSVGTVHGPISTLDRNNLQPADHIDISNETTPLVTTSNVLNHPFSFIYSPKISDNTEPYSALPFPQKTRGFLYYVPKTIFDAPLSGQVRFRLCEKDFVFAKGVKKDSDDLRFSTLSTSRRWNIPLLMILNYSQYPFFARLYEQLLADGFVSPELKEQGVEALQPTLNSGRKLHIADNMIFSPNDPFLYHFGRRTIRLWKVKDGHARCLVFENPMKDHRPDAAFLGQGSKTPYPYEGEAIASIETIFGVAYIRLLRVISLSQRPPLESSGQHTGSSCISPPRAGQLVMLWDHQRPKPAWVPFTCNGLGWNDDRVPAAGEVAVGIHSVVQNPKNSRRA